MRLVLGSRILLPFLWGSGDGKRGRGNDDSGGLGGTLWSFPLVLGCCLIVQGKTSLGDGHAFCREKFISMRNYVMLQKY